MSSSSGMKGGEPSEMEVVHHGRSRRGLWIAIIAIVAVVAIVAYVALAGLLSPPVITLQGAGSSFVYPLMSKWAGVYNSSTVRINYASVGSGTGITRLEQKIVDFAGSDAPLQPSDRVAAPNALHIPESIGAVTVAYNVPGVPTGLNLTGTIIAGIYLNTIKNWNDTSIAALNPGVTLPGLTITPVYRSDSSGTTFVFTSYLSKVNSTWNTTVGASKNPGTKWPTGIGAPQNAGVAGKILLTSGAVGYVELAYAVQNSMTVAKVQNPAGQYILPSLNSTAAAAANAAPALPSGAGDWANVSILNAPGATSYPIASFTYIIVYKELNVEGSVMTLPRAQALVNFLWWVVQLNEGQSYAAGLVYVPLPQTVVTLDEATINSITLNGQTVHS
jgi:phosphate transport system substrate-binding protein